MLEDQYSQKSKQQKEYYNQTANQYDQWHVAPKGAQIVDAWNFANLQIFLNKYLPNKGQQKIQKVLELGCGTGRLSNSLFQLSSEVYGVDLSQKVLNIAQKKYPKLKLTCSEIIDLPYADQFFDLVIINGSLHHFFAVQKTFQEAQRVLKTGGAFVLLGEPSSQFLKPYNPFFYTWLINRVFNKIIFLFQKNRPKEEIEPIAESYKPLKLKKQLAENGFAIKQFYTYDYFVRPNNKLGLKLYKTYLNFEHQVLAKIFPYLGLAIQAFCIKKDK